LAYLWAVRKFFTWSDARGLRLDDIRPLHIAAYNEALYRGGLTVTGGCHPPAAQRQ
jgi:hypothetical protein